MKNKEPLILIVVVIFTLLTYYLVEPYAHSQMHKHVASQGFSYSDLPAITKTGDATNGKELVLGAAACSGCHSIKAAGVEPTMEPTMAAGAYGVNPPDLSNAGALYDAKFLADLIKNPAHALKVEHKFDPAKGQMHPMIAFAGAGGDLEQEVADIVAYLQSIAPADVTPKDAFDNACGRCHALKYENWTQIGEKPSFKDPKDGLRFDISLLEYQEHLSKYMGKLPPDLSAYYRSRSLDFLNTFIENPQSQLAGTAMPRVGIKPEIAQKVIEHLADAGDTKRHERSEIGLKVMIFTVVFALFALLWKKQIWRDLH